MIYRRTVLVGIVGCGMRDVGEGDEIIMLVTQLWDTVLTLVVAVCTVQYLG